MGLEHYGYIQNQKKLGAVFRSQHVLGSTSGRTNIAIGTNSAWTLWLWLREWQYLFHHYLLNTLEVHC